MKANHSPRKYWTLLLSLWLAVGAAMAATPPTVPPAGAPAAPPATKAKSKTNPPFVGVVQKVDIAGATLTLNGKDGGRVFHVTPETRVTKNGQPAKLTDAKLGEEAAGTFKDEGNKRIAVSLRLGPKPEKAAKSKDSAPAKK